MTLLALLRHAETPWSASGRIQGRTDIALSASGREMLRCKALPPEYREMRAVTSPLQRCVETANLLGLGHAKREARIAEMHWGEWEGRSLTELRSQLGVEMSENEARGLDFAPPGGETPRQVLDRVGGWLSEIARNGEATLAITHRGVIRVVLAAATGWDMRGKPPVKLDWSSLQVFRLDGAGLPLQVDANVPLVQAGSSAAVW